MLILRPIACILIGMVLVALGHRGVGGVLIFSAVFFPLVPPMKRSSAPSPPLEKRQQTVRQVLWEHMDDVKRHK